MCGFHLEDRLSPKSCQSHKVSAFCGTVFVFKGIVSKALRKIKTFSFFF